MTDTERTERVERVELDFTPTTTPSWVPKRIARGTIPPPLVSKLPLVPRPLAVKLIDSPRRWGRVIRVPLDPAPRVQPVPRKAISPTPFAAALLAAIVPLAIVLATLETRVALAAPQLAVTQPAPTPVEPTVTPLLAAGEGLLVVVSTPTMRVMIDGHDTGLTTPQELRLSAGRHRVTLVDAAGRLEDHSEVIVGDTPVTLARDLSAFLE